MGYGVAGVCWRGPRIFEGPISKAIVKNWIGFYNRYRDTLTSDMLIHVRRPDGQNLDAILHANPSSDKAKGLLFVFNPTDAAITTNLSVPLYYTGLSESATVVRGNNNTSSLDTTSNLRLSSHVAFPLLDEVEVEEVNVPLRRDYSIAVEMTVSASGYAWWVINDGVF